MFFFFFSCYKGIMQALKLEGSSFIFFSQPANSFRRNFTFPVKISNEEVTLIFVHVYRKL